MAGVGVIIGDNNSNTLTGTAGNDTLQGFGGNDSIIGLTGIDRAVYTDATGGITADLAAGTVSGSGVGTDTLTGIEAIQGSNFIDHYSAAGFTGDAEVPGVPVDFNSFEGMGGDDLIIGSVNVQGQVLTRVVYSSATGAVTVDFADATTVGTDHFTGTAIGDVSVGTDHFTNVNTVVGSGFGDTLRGSNNANGTYEQYDGRAGNDLIDGRGGYDFAVYNNDPATVSGITVNLAAGIVTGDASVGIDTLRNVEAVRGTNFADTYNAVGFSGSSTNAGSLGTFNNFDGVGGDDIILGNGNTRIQYTNALDAVTVDIVLGKAHGTAAGDAAGTGTDTFSGVNAVIGSMFGDTISGSGNNETFMGLAGDDTIDGRGGFDTVQYNNMTYTTGGISVDLAIGRVIGDASTGTDTLRSIESIQGTNFNDVYNAVGFGDSSHLDPTLNNVGNNGTYNQFEGLDGDDQITGNGNTRAVYLSAAAGVTVDLVLGTGKGTAAGDLANVGTDTFIGGVNGAVGSNFADMLLGSANASGTVEQFDGRGGNDTLDGRGGFDQATYANDANVTTGITVDMFSGTADGDAAVGHDTLISIESVIGTRFNDVYNAANFTGGSFGTFNEFQGYGGDDQITGNGNTQLGYNNATSGVTIDMTTGNAAGDASVGHDTFTGVSSVIGSNFDDTISGSNASEIFNGGSGNDTIRGRGGNDAMTGGAGADTFVYATGDGADQITDFLHVQGDRIDVTGVGGVLGLSDIVSHAAQQGSDTVITFSPGNSISLQNVTLGSLVASDFIFAAAGSTPTANDNNNSLVGTGGADTLSGLAGNDRLQGLADNDLLDGGLGFDRAVYTDATGGIIVDLAHGKSFGAGVGSDTLVSIEGAVGSEFADILDASGFTGSSGVPGTPIGFNEFEGRGGNDTITGLVNSQGATLTRVSYVNATAGVTVDFDAHYADGNASVGHDTFIGAGVANVFGSSSVDTLLGSDNPNGTVETFDGRAGNDTINGRGGFDRADYNNDPAVTTGIKVELAIGKVSPINPPDLTIGTDTLLSVEAVRGTSWDDTYDATGFGSGSANVGSNGTFNEFTGVGGNDTIIGNGNTRLSFNGATAGVTVDFQTGPTPGTGTAAGDASVGTDSFSGVNAVQASMFDDTLSGSSNNDTFTGLAGDDHIDGRGGFDTASYNNIYFTTGGINVDMASGDVTGDASIGHDTLRSIEAIQGTNFGDTFVATGYGLAGALNIGNNDTFNQFEGLAGNDTITGNGNTRLIFTNATAGVTINLATGDANGDASVGHDTFIGVNSVTGSNAVDTYVATGFGSFNAFQGMGGDDIITGSGNTQIFFTNATAGVTADLATGNAGGDASVGHDTFTGVNSVLGSNFSDTISGSNANEIFNGGSGGDILTGGAGSDNFVFRFSSGNDTVTDFTHNQDTIDIHDYATFTQNDSASFAAWIASAAVEEQGANTLIHLDTNNSVLLSNVAKASLAMNDFILHPAGQ
ncbi:beta strand repeat-containing protein [Bradyrhizobium sp. URHD0069]|uniref:beta strand repeat-containing protein n=1 Tax=Bradyrhizobium sp. URHD0069 TaxID=1380355 RepID=UPI003527E0D6